MRLVVILVLIYELTGAGIRRRRRRRRRCNEPGHDWYVTELIHKIVLGELVN
jgi:hypothetical protein